MTPPLCLSIRQPWAWLITTGLKNIENRTWSTSYRGPFYVHASQTMTRDDYESCEIFIAGFSSVVLPPFKDLERGGIVGSATILDCVTYHPSEWFCGDYGFVLGDQLPMPFTRCPGRLHFFPLSSEITVPEIATREAAIATA